MRNMANDPKSRRMAEALLNLHLKNAEKETLRNPEVREMVMRLRRMYEEDKEGIFTAFAVTARDTAGPPARGSAPPPSKIPNLILLLSELAELAEQGPAQSRPHPLDPTIVRPVKPPLPYEPSESAPAKEPVPEDDRQRELIREIEQARQVLRDLRKEEPQIKGRRGKYGLPGERLKAERMLRELPGEILQMEHKLQLLREGIL